MRVLVTGGLGFIGSNFVRRVLRSDGFSVVNLDSRSYGSNTESLRDVASNKRYRFVKADLCDSELVEELLRDADAVINFAAQTHVDRSLSDPASFLKSNTAGVFTILEAMRKSEGDAKFVQVGTDEEYGDIEHGSFSEKDPLSPSSPYSATKAAASMLVHAYHRSYGVKACVTRCTNNFGPYQFPEKLIPKTVIRARLGLNVPVYGSGLNIRDWLYVEDHCDAVFRVMEKGRPGEIYNVSSGNELTNLELIGKVLGAMGKPREMVVHVEDRPGHDLRYSLNSSKIRAELGWVPIYGFDEQLKRTVRWYLDNEWWWRPLADNRILASEPWKEVW